MLCLTFHVNCVINHVPFRHDSQISNMLICALSDTIVINIQPTFNAYSNLQFKLVPMSQLNGATFYVYLMLCCILKSDIVVLYMKLYWQLFFVEYHKDWQLKHNTSLRQVPLQIIQLQKSQRHVMCDLS